jgi:hypothetical protein
MIPLISPPVHGPGPLLFKAVVAGTPAAVVGVAVAL